MWIRILHPIRQQKNENGNNIKKPCGNGVCATVLKISSKKSPCSFEHGLFVLRAEGIKKLFKPDFHLHRVVVGKDKAFIKGAYGAQLNIGQRKDSPLREAQRA